MSIEEPLLDADDIQGHVLTGFGRAFELLLGLRFEIERLDAGKAALRSIAGEVTPLRPAAASLDSSFVPQALDTSSSPVFARFRASSHDPPDVAADLRQGFRTIAFIAHL